MVCLQFHPHFHCNLLHVCMHFFLALIDCRIKKKKHIYKMYLMYYLNENGERVYTLQKIDPNGKPTLSAHPARFSAEDKYSRERILYKRRFNLLLTQKSPPIY